MKGTLFLELLSKRFLVGIVLIFLSANFLSAQTRTLRIVCYNIQADTTGIATVGIITPTCGLIEPYEGSGGTYNTNCSGSVINGGVLEGIGEEIINGDPAQPIDVLALEETTSNPTTVQPIVNALNSFYSVYNYLYPTPAGYAMSPYQATEEGNSPTGGNGPNALVYNTNTLQLLASVGIATPTGSGNGMYRQCVRYEFAPAGATPGTNNEFYVYVSHYKASSGSSDDAARAGEARIIRNDESTNVPATAGVLYVGDYNPDDNSIEAGYQTICSNSAPDGIYQGQGVDPLNIHWSSYPTSAATNINWSVNTTSPQILFMLSEESYELRYRDDLQVMTSNVYYQVAGGLNYVPGTYHSFGNNATTTWGQSVNNGGNTALNDLDPVKTNATGLNAAVLLQDLTGASDHLPVVADYTIPITAPAPVASFTASPTNGVVPLTVSFSNLSANATNYTWGFGDGNTSALTNASDTYMNPGLYSVTLTAVGAGGTNILTLTNYITVLSLPPVAAFAACPTSGVVLLPVAFSNSSTGATNYIWEFGDGNTSTNLNPVNIYTNAGVYSVTLSATGPGGTNTLTLTNYIVAVSPPSLQLGNFVSSANGGIYFTASNSDGTLITPNQASQIEIFVTTNLALNSMNWTLLTNATQLTNGALQINDTNGVFYPQRFYQAVETQ